MIHVIDDYYLDADENCVALVIDTHTINKKTEENIYRRVGYYSDIKNALLYGLLRDKQRKIVKQGEKTLTQVVTELEDLERRLKKMLPDLGGMK